MSSERDFLASATLTRDDLGGIVFSPLTAFTMIVKMTTSCQAPSPIVPSECRSWSRSARSGEPTRIGWWPWGTRRDDLSARFLSRYERAWRGRIGAEIRAGRLFRRIFERMTGEEIDAVFRVLAADGVLEEVAAEAALELRHPRLSGLLLRKAMFRA